MTVANNIKSTLPKTDSAKEFMKFVEERSQTADKSLAGTLMGNFFLYHSQFLFLAKCYLEEIFLR